MDVLADQNVSAAGVSPSFLEVGADKETLPEERDGVISLHCTTITALLAHIGSSLCIDDCYEVPASFVNRLGEDLEFLKHTVSRANSHFLTAKERADLGFLSAQHAGAFSLPKIRTVRRNIRRVGDSAAFESSTFHKFPAEFNYCGATTVVCSLQSNRTAPVMMLRPSSWVRWTSAFIFKLQSSPAVTCHLALSRTPMTYTSGSFSAVITLLSSRKERSYSSCFGSQAKLVDSAFLKRAYTSRQYEEASLPFSTSPGVLFSTLISVRVLDRDKRICVSF